MVKSKSYYLFLFVHISISTKIYPLGLKLKNFNSVIYQAQTAFYITGHLGSQFALNYVHLLQSASTITITVTSENCLY